MTSAEDYVEGQISEALATYGYPAEFAVGVVCNSLALIVLQRPPFHGKAIRLTLTLLSVVDTLLLVLVLPRLWALAVFEVDLRTFHPALCCIHTYIAYLLPQLSSCTVVVITVERAVAVTRPLRARQICSTVHLALAWTLILVGLACLDIPFLLAMEVSQPNTTNSSSMECLVDSNWESFIYNIMYWLDFIVVGLVPILLISALNILIGIHVSKQRHLGASGDRNKKWCRSTTSMLILVSALFLLFTTPLELYFVVGRTWIWQSNDPLSLARISLTYTVCTLLFYLNSTINFFLYALSGSLFREALCTAAQRRSKVKAACETSHQVSSFCNPSNHTGSGYGSLVNNDIELDMSALGGVINSSIKSLSYTDKVTLDQANHLDKPYSVDTDIVSFDNFCTDDKYSVINSICIHL